MLQMDLWRKRYLSSLHSMHSTYVHMEGRVVGGINFHMAMNLESG